MNVREGKMREIMFRAQNFAGHWIYSEKVGLAVFFDYLECDNPVTNKRTLGQFTGLKDKNGVEVYEGDILKDPDENEILGKVHRADDGQYICGGYTGNDFDELEVIGNIYENPEALKEGGGR